MMVRSWLGLALVVVVALWSGAARAQGASPPAESDAVAVLPLELIGNVPAGRPALEAAVVRGLIPFAATTLEATQTSARLIAAGTKLPCEDAACWTAAGKAAGARHLVAGRVERKGPNFEVEFRLLDGASGRLLATESSKCEAADCSVGELTRQTVRELARTVLSGAPGGKGPPAVTPPTSVATATAAPGAAAAIMPEAPPAAASVAAESRADSGPSTARRLLPYTAIAAGLGVAGAGVFYMNRDGSCAEKADIARACNTYRETMWEGVALTGLGAALLATGVVVAITDHQDARDRTVVLIGPRSLMLRGRF